MRQVFCVNILDFLPCAKLIILYLFVGSFKFIFKQLQYFGGGLIEFCLWKLPFDSITNPSEANRNTYLTPRFLINSNIFS